MQRKRKGFKRKPNPKFQYKTNRQIRHQTVRLVGDNVEAGVFDIREAQRKANELGLDLVEITAKADPPVCQIVDFNKFLYEKKKKEKELKAKQVKTVVKEIRFTPNTDDHDFDFKAKHAEKFLEEGNKVKIFVQFRGRNIVFKERGEIILLRFAQRLEDVGVPEQMPQQEGRRMFMYLAPKKSTKGKKPKNASEEAAATAVADAKADAPAPAPAVADAPAPAVAEVKADAPAPDVVAEPAKQDAPASEKPAVKAPKVKPESEATVVAEKGKEESAE